MPVSHYSIRQLNPFNGTLQILETPDARAFSANGTIWRIQVLADAPEHTWRSNSDGNTTKQFFNWAIWSEKAGFRDVIANPILNLGQMQAAAEKLAGHLRVALRTLPFTGRDRFEKWGCNAKGEPLVLLDSATTADDMLKDLTDRGDRVEKWHASSSDQPLFVSGVLGDRGIPGSRHSLHLTQQINDRITASHWLERNGDKTIDCASGEINQEAAIPLLGIREHWDEQQLTDLVADYLAWQSPLLLTLQLPDSHRERLEKLAGQHPLQVDNLYRLYPTLYNPRLIDQVRVQARLLRSQ